MCAMFIELLLSSSKKGEIDEDDLCVIKASFPFPSPAGNNANAFHSVSRGPMIAIRVAGFRKHMPIPLHPSN